MPEDQQLSVTVTESIKIFKYAEGVNPEEGEPFEVLERSTVLTGEDAKQAIQLYEEAKDNATD